MKSSAKYLLAAFFLFSPALASAQHVGQVACARQDNYTYLYSSITTMEVVRTLQCGEQLEVTGRYQGFFSVRTSNGETGYIGEGSLVLLKDKPGPKVPASAAPQIARPRTAYDEPAATPPSANPVPAGFDLTLLNGTPIRMQLRKTISSATAHLNDQVELEISNDVIIDGLCVISKGALATGTVTEAEPKKRMGHSGKLGFLINFVLLSDNEKAKVRSYQEDTGSNSAGGAINPLAHGKDVVFVQGTEFTAYVDGDIYLKRAAFPRAKEDGNSVPAAPNPPQPPKR